jgi:pimeloyl-ACP methyl ester carboxylesterase
MAQQVRVGDVTFSVEDEGPGSGQDQGSGPGQDQGRGSPIVFIHGWSMSGHFFSRQLSHFAAAHRTIIPDLRGHGRSQKVQHGHTVPNYAADLYAILTRLSVRRPVLVGWSMGAMVAYEYLKAYGPASVAGLVIVDQPPSDFAWDGYEFGVITLDALREMNEQLQLDQPGLVHEFTQLMLHEPDEQTMAWMSAEILRVPPVIASTILADQTLRDYREYLPHIEVPTLVLFGEDEKLTSPKAGQYIAEAIPGARLRTFPASSHCPFWEESDAFNAAVETFAAELSR